MVDLKENGMSDVVSVVERAHVQEKAALSETLSPDELYFREQVEAIRRVYALIHPKERVRIVLRALDHARGAPEGVTIVHGNPGFPAVDAAYLGYVDFGGSTAAKTNKAKKIDVTIFVGIPRPFRQGQEVQEKTAPDFQNHPLLERLLWASPMMFEQLKYQYEKRSRQQCLKRHSFTQIKRATLRPIGDLVRDRNLTKAPAILIGFHWLEMGGAEKLAFDCVKWARAAGLRVLVVADQAEIQRLAPKLEGDPNVEFIRADAYLHPSKWYDFLVNLIATENIRAIHIHHNLKLYDNLMMLKATFPDLVAIDSTHIIEHTTGGFPRTSGVWTQYIDYHHVIDRELVSFYLDKFGVSKKVLLGRMLDPVEIQADTTTPDLRLQVGQKFCRLVFIGRMVHQKRAPLVVAIASKLHRWAKQQSVTLQVDMVGTGAYLDVVKNMIKRANLSNVITLHPADTDVPALLGKADILLLPSSNEGLALVCYEAIENGVIPISTNVGGQKELVAEGLLVPASPQRCVRATVALIERLLTDSDFLENCKVDTLAQYRNLRADPTAEETLGTLYRDIAESSIEQ